MIRSKCTLTDRQGAAIKRLGIALLMLVELGEIAQLGRDQGGVEA